jgi:predicted DNA-binding protein
MSSDQITLRIPRELAQALARRARERGVPKSQLVREALRGYLAQPVVRGSDARAVLERFRGTVPLDHAAIERDALARQIRDHNWRE